MQSDNFDGVLLLIYVVCGLKYFTKAALAYLGDVFELLVETARVKYFLEGWVMAYLADCVNHELWWQFRSNIYVLTYLFAENTVCQIRWFWIWFLNIKTIRFDWRLIAF